MIQLGKRRVPLPQGKVARPRFAPVDTGRQLLHNTMQQFDGSDASVARLQATLQEMHRHLYFPKDERGHTWLDDLANLVVQHMYWQADGLRGQLEALFQRIFSGVDTAYAASQGSFCSIPGQHLVFLHELLLPHAQQIVPTVAVLNGLLRHIREHQGAKLLARLLARAPQHVIHALLDVKLSTPWWEFKSLRYVSACFQTMLPRAGRDEQLHAVRAFYTRSAWLQQLSCGHCKKPGSVLTNEATRGLSYHLSCLHSAGAHVVQEAMSSLPADQWVVNWLVLPLVPLDTLRSIQCAQPDSVTGSLILTFMRSHVTESVAARSALEEWRAREQGLSEDQRRTMLHVCR